jgi:hypothetical protein
LKRKIVLAGNIAPIFFGARTQPIDPLSTAVSQIISRRREYKSRVKPRKESPLFRKNITVEEF